MKMRMIAVLLLLCIFAFKALSQTFDATYDGTPYQSTVQNQGDLGVCGIFAPTAMLEASLLKQGIVTDPNFHFSNYDTAYSASVKYLGAAPSLTYNSSTGGYDGWASGEWYVYGLARGTGGLVSTASTPYPTTLTDYSGLALSVPDSNAPKSGYTIHDIYSTFTSSGLVSSASYENVIKSYVQNYGGATVAYATQNSSDFSTTYNSSTSSFRNASTNSTLLGSYAHESLVVGWDDNKTITVNGVTTTGAWLIKNSWGTSFGNNGYFWMSYDSTIYGSITSAVARGGYGRVYSHAPQDNLTSAGTWSSLYVLQSYVPEGEEFLQAVSLNYLIQAVRNGSSTDLASYELKIYSTKTGNTLSDLLYSGTGNLHDGLNTIDLATLVQLHAGNDFYILLKQTGTVATGNGINSFSGGVAGNSWLSDDGVTYWDLATTWDGLAYTWDIDALMAIPETSTAAMLLCGLACFSFVACGKFTFKLVKTLA